MKDLLTYIAQNLVTKPENVCVTCEERDDALVLKLSVDPVDMGRVIGRGGRIAKDIRTLIKSASARENKKVFVDIVD